jgi:predicted short-subunit dehydrogenase-like oxidoreductase (DUF2520 family)
MIENVVIIGAGNLATQLGLALYEKNIQVKQVYSRTKKSAQALAGKLNASYAADLSKLDTDADLYVIAVKDSAIQEILENLPTEDGLIVHTAGSVPMKILEGFSVNYGVFYPLQTFSKDRKVDFKTIPVCIEANHPSNLVKLQELAGKLSGTVRQVNSEERKILHLAAVFVNNFVNHFYAIGADLLYDNKMSFDLLKPLIMETASKIETLNPILSQTGPARRNDQNVIQSHLKLLEDKPEYRKIYSFVSDSIFQLSKKSEHDIF